MLSPEARRYRGVSRGRRQVRPSCLSQEVARRHVHHGSAAVRRRKVRRHPRTRWQSEAPPAGGAGRAERPCEAFAAREATRRLVLARIMMCAGWPNSSVKRSLAVVVEGHDSELVFRLDRLRNIVEWKCSELDAAGATATVGASTITLGGLLKHLALVEDDYFTLRLHGRPLPAPWDEVEFTELVDWAWSSAAGDSPDALVALWRAAVGRSRAALDEAATDGGFDRRAVLWPAEPAATVRDIVLDLIEEYARHCGHADLIRESIDGLVGEDPPR